MMKPSTLTSEILGFKERLIIEYLNLSLEAACFENIQRITLMSLLIVGFGFSKWERREQWRRFRMRQSSDRRL